MKTDPNKTFEVTVTAKIHDRRRLVFAWDDDPTQCVHGIKLRWTCDECNEHALIAALNEEKSE